MSAFNFIIFVGISIFSQVLFVFKLLISLITSFPLVYLALKLSSKPFLFTFRSSRLDVFCKKRVLRNFAKFTGKHMCQSSGTGVFL